MKATIEQVIYALRCQSDVYPGCNPECPYRELLECYVTDIGDEEEAGRMKYLVECNVKQTSIDAADLLESMAARAEKYRLHDLRKNPDDLPTMCYIKQYDRYDSDFVEFMYSEEELPIIGYLRKKNGKLVGCEENWRTDDVDEYNVIAWREIEPLEVEDEN